MNAGTAVAVMLAQMQNKTPPRNLTVKRGGRVEAMIPIDREAKEPQVELVCLLYIEYTQNGDDRTKPDLHNCVPSEDRARPSPTFIGRTMRLLPLRPARHVSPSIGGRFRRSPAAIPQPSLLICQFGDIDGALQHIARCCYYACNRRLKAPIVTRFMFLVLERHHVVAPTSARSLAAPVPTL